MFLFIRIPSFAASGAFALSRFRSYAELCDHHDTWHLHVRATRRGICLIYVG